MNSKLDQLTQRLYDEGLEKGRAEAERIVAEAKDESARLLAEARAEAEAIVRKAGEKAEDLSKNTMTEIALAGKQAVAKIKAEIASAIVARMIGNGVKEAALDAAYIQEMLVAVAKNWNGADAGKVSLQALLPEAARKGLEATLAARTDALLQAGVEVGWSNEVKSGFKIGPKEGGYYISFSDADVEALLGEYLREKVARILFTK